MAPVGWRRTRTADHSRHLTFRAYLRLEEAEEICNLLTYLMNVAVDGYDDGNLPVIDSDWPEVESIYAGRTNYSEL